MHTAAELEALLARMNTGELTASNVAAAGGHLLDFFQALEPEQFALLGNTLVRIALWDARDADGQPLLSAAQRGLARYTDVRPRVKIRSVQSALRPMLRLLELAPKLARQRGGDALLAHLLRCTYAFLVPFQDGRMAQIARELLDLASSPHSAATAVRAATTALDLVTATVETILRGQVETRPEAPDDAGLAAALDKARAQLIDLQARVQDKLRRAPRGGGESPSEECARAAG